MSFDFLKIINTQVQGINKEIFIKELQALYHYPFFNNLLDVILSLLIKDKLTIELLSKRITESEEGLCVTVVKPWYNKITEKIMHNKRYNIIIKKTAKNVIIHEMAHALEKELELNLEEEFMQLIYQDINNNRANLILKQLFYNLMIAEVGAYPVKARQSEVFARYFEIYTLTKEINYRNAVYEKDLTNFFLHTNKWKETKLDKLCKSHILEQAHNYRTQLAPEINTNNTYKWKTAFDSGKKDWKNKIKSSFDLEE